MTPQEALSPAIFMLDDDGKAYEVHFFCSSDCQRKHVADALNKNKCALGFSAYVAGAKCEQCGNPVCVTKGVAS
jgi:hypothetical protein